MPAKNPARDARHEAVVAYAEQMAGTEFDLDPELESAGIEHLLETTEKAE